MKTMSLRNRLKIELMKFITDSKWLEGQMIRLKKGIANKYVSFDYPVGFSENATKGLLVFDNRLTDLSEDATKIIRSASELAYSDEVRAIQMIDTIFSSLDEGEPDLTALYKFYESCHFSLVAHEIGFTFSGDGFDTPILSAIYMANPEIMAKAFSGHKWEHQFEEDMQKNVFKIFEENSNGVDIHNKLTELIEAEYSYLKDAYKVPVA